MSGEIPTVIVKLNGAEYEGCIYAGNVRVLIIDEAFPRDRVYQLTAPSTPAEIEALIGESPIGSYHDGKLTENEMQGIRALAARRNGTPLRLLKGEKEE